MPVKTTSLLVSSASALAALALAAPAAAEPPKGLPGLSRPAPLPPPPDVAGPPKTATKTATGLASTVLKAGIGSTRPGPSDTVVVNYTGWTTDGKMFDSSVLRGQPARFPVGGVIPGWTEALQLMVKGEKRRLWIPEQIAYAGQRGAPQGMLVFDVELIDIVSAPAAPQDVAWPPKGAKKTKSGLASKVLKQGEPGGKPPRSFDVVEVHYTGWTTDGKMFDSSVQRGRPVKFPLDRVIPGWTEGVQLMVKGEKRRLWIPEQLAYKGKAGAPQGMLVFDVELLDIIPGKAPIAAPEDVAQPPKQATRTASGLAYVVLKTGSGDKKPTAKDKVSVHYTGWTTDGKMFDSSVQRGTPATFGVTQVIAGWTEMLKLMAVGEKVRVWIPENLAYQGRPGAPAGMLVFEVELLGIE